MFNWAYFSIVVGQQCSLYTASSLVEQFILFLTYGHVPVLQLQQPCAAIHCSRVLSTSVTDDGRPIRETSLHTGTDIVVSTLQYRAGSRSNLLIEESASIVLTGGHSSLFILNVNVTYSSYLTS